MLGKKDKKKATVVNVQIPQKPRDYRPVDKCVCSTVPSPTDLQSTTIRGCVTFSCSCNIMSSNMYNVASISLSILHNFLSPKQGDLEVNGHRCWLSQCGGKPRWSRSILFTISIFFLPYSIHTPFLFKPLYSILFYSSQLSLFYSILFNPLYSDLI